MALRDFFFPWKYPLILSNDFIVENASAMRDEIWWAPEIQEWLDISIPSGVKLVRKKEKTFIGGLGQRITKRINIVYFKREEDRLMFKLKWAK
jgi:hypothetical protein